MIMEAIPISHVFVIRNGAAEMSSWNAAIQQLEADKAQNPQNASIDQQDIGYYQQLEANLQELEKTAAAYRQSDNDPALAKQINILTSRQETLTQLIGLDTYIKSLEADTQKNPQDAAENAQKIANAEAQEQCIKQFETVYEAYQQTGDAADAAQLNSLIQQLQQLRSEDPTGPYSSGPIWEDFQAVVSKYTVLEFNGHKYAVSP
jgi:hypothetical protein